MTVELVVTRNSLLVAMTVELVVTRNSLLVIHHPAPTTHANYVCCGVVGIGMFPSRD